MIRIVGFQQLKPPSFSRAILARPKPMPSSLLRQGCRPLKRTQFFPPWLSHNLRCGLMSAVAAPLDLSLFHGTLRHSRFVTDCFRRLTPRASTRQPVAEI
jgi:hypothetical protein